MTKQSKLETTLAATLEIAEAQAMRTLANECVEDLRALWLHNRILRNYFRVQYTIPSSLNSSIQSILKRAKTNASTASLEADFGKLSAVVQEVEQDLNVKLGGQIEQAETTIGQLIQIARMSKARIQDPDLASYVRSLSNRYGTESTRTLRELSCQIRNDGEKYQARFVNLIKVITARLKIPLSRTILSDLLSVEGIPLRKLSAADLTNLSKSQLKSRLRLVLTNPKDSVHAV
jgi:hypothetical protein